MVTALEEYLEALHAGRPWSRDEFLAQHSEIADALNQCLSGLEFIQAAGAQLDGSQSFFGVQSARFGLPPAFSWVTIESSAKSAVEAWGSFTRPSRSRWAAMSP